MLMDYDALNAKKGICSSWKGWKYIQVVLSSCEDKISITLELLVYENNKEHV
jgi:hypothetical protein